MTDYHQIFLTSTQIQTIISIIETANNEAKQECDEKGYDYNNPKQGSIAKIIHAVLRENEAIVSYLKTQLEKIEKYNV